MNNLSGDNDIDLTGLTLSEKEPNWLGTRATLRKPDPGHVGAENISVGRSLRLFEECTDPRLLPSDNTCHGEGCVAPGAIDLSGARIGELVMSRHSFESTDPDKRAAEVGVVLAGASVDEVTIADLSTASRKSLSLPRPIDLRDIRVGQWNIFDEKKPLPSRRLTYRSLAGTDDRFRRSTWLSLERSLRNQGHSGDADFIYRQMAIREEKEVWRDAKVGPRKWVSVPLQVLRRIFLRWPFRHFLGYGTQPLRLLGIILAYWVLALPVYLEAKNYEPSLQMLGADIDSFSSGTDKPLAGTYPQGWPVMAGLLTSISHHVPVIAIVPREKWALRDTGVTCYSIAWLASDQDSGPGTANEASRPASEDHGVSVAVAGNPATAFPSVEEGQDVCSALSLPITPQDFGLIAAILNFIAWPFVLAFAINRFVRIGRD
jgi:hypothetical protein